MTLLSEILQRLPVPPDFGADAPYARFSRVEEGGAGGEDITLEYKTEGLAPGAAEIQFSHSEWRFVEGASRTKPLTSVTFNVATGGWLFFDDAEALQSEEAMVQSVRDALIHADQMKLVQ